MCLVTGKRSGSEEGQVGFVVVGFSHLRLLKLFPIIINQLFCFLCCYFFFWIWVNLWQILFPCKGIKAEISHYHLNANVCSLHLPSLRSRQENQWWKHTLILPGDDKKPLGLCDKRFSFYSEIAFALKKKIEKKIQPQNTQAHIFWNTSFFVCWFGF